jgi:hypothetical protein
LISILYQFHAPLVPLLQKPSAFAIHPFVALRTIWDFAPCEARPTLRALDWRRFFEKKLGKKLQPQFTESVCEAFEILKNFSRKVFKPSETRTWQKTSTSVY